MVICTVNIFANILFPHETVFLLVFHYFCDFQKKDLDPNEPYIKKFQTNLGNDCLSVISVFGLTSFARLQPIRAYVDI